MNLSRTVTIVCTAALLMLLSGCGAGPARVRPISPWSDISGEAAQSGWFTVTRGAQTVVLYCTTGDTPDGPLQCDAHAVEMSGKEGRRIISYPVAVPE
jgi:hypothetical protein